MKNLTQSIASLLYSALTFNLLLGSVQQASAQSLIEYNLGNGAFVQQFDSVLVGGTLDGQSPGQTAPVGYIASSPSFAIYRTINGLEEYVLDTGQLNQVFSNAFVGGSLDGQSPSQISPVGYFGTFAIYDIGTNLEEYNLANGAFNQAFSSTLVGGTLDGQSPGQLTPVGFDFTGDNLAIYDTGLSLEEYNISTGAFVQAYSATFSGGALNSFDPGQLPLIGYDAGTTNFGIYVIPEPSSALLISSTLLSIIALRKWRLKSSHRL